MSTCKTNSLITSYIVISIRNRGLFHWSLQNKTMAHSDFFNIKTTLLRDYQIATTLLAKYKSSDFSSNTEISSIAQ